MHTSDMDRLGTSGERKEEGGRGGENGNDGPRAPFASWALPAGTLLPAATHPLEVRPRSCQGEALVPEVGVDAGYSGVPRLPRIPSVWIRMSVGLHEEYKTTHVVI